MTRRNPWTDGAGTAAVVGLSFLAAAALLSLGGHPADSLAAFFTGPVSSGLAWGNLLNEALVLSLTGLAAALAFGAGAFNLGGEGQIYLGGLASVAVALAVPTWGAAGTLLALFAAVAAGLALGALSGGLKIAFDADELITTFLLSAAALPLVDALMTGAFGDTSSMLIASRPVAEGLWLPGLLAPSNLNVGALAAVPLVLLFGVLVHHTAWGYRLRLVGRNRDFARYAGISTAAYSLVPLGLSGGLNGLAGGLGVLGTHHALVQGFSFGWGWSGIAVALIARTNPWYVLPSALLLAYLDQASRSVVLQGQFPFQLSALFQAAILFFITARLVLPRLRKRR